MPHIDSTASVATGADNVRGDARIEDYAAVADSAEVSGQAVVAGYAHVGGYATITGRALVRGQARIGDYAHIEGQSSISGDTCIAGRAKVTGSSKLSGRVIVSGDAEIHDGIAHGELDLRHGVRVLEEAHLQSIGIMHGHTAWLVRHADGVPMIHAGCQVHGLDVNTWIGAAEDQTGDVSPTEERRIRAAIAYAQTLADLWTCQTPGDGVQ